MFEVLLVGECYALAILILRVDDAEVKNSVIVIEGIRRRKCETTVIRSVRKPGVGCDRESRVRVPYHKGDVGIIFANFESFSFNLVVDVDYSRSNEAAAKCTRFNCEFKLFSKEINYKKLNVTSLSSYRH